ncbi:NAD(P)-dependent oxidoreductase [candidate division WOR-3 bacterium]|nr:NAD(P)-dependent oxidoreductase [candidate division WOR-3 bacterium]
MEIANLVTSPFGIGEKLILELLNRGESVYTIFPSPKDVPMSFLGKINLKYGFIKFDRDVNLEKVLPKKVKNVFHLHEIYTGTFTKIFKSNPGATLLLLDWARRNSVSRFIYLSSGEVYGHGKNLDEKCAYNPRSFYATTKFEAEILFRYYYKSLEINTVRIFFPFGKNLNQGYISNLHQSIKSGDNIETEYSVISPTFINDTIEPLIKIREIKGNQIFNICGSPVKVEVLIDEVKKICGNLPKRVSVGKTELSGDSSKAREILGYRETPFQEALKKSFQNN